MASKLTVNDISEITRQSDVTSKPVRDNFTNTKNKINELVDEVAAAAIGTTNAETTAARPYHTNLKERLDSIWDGRRNYLKNGGEVTAQTIPDMTAAIAAGEAKIQGIDVKWVAANTGTITVPPLETGGVTTRLDYIVANTDSTLTVVVGNADVSPVFPSIASTQIVLAALVIKSSTTTLNVGTEIFAFKSPENPYFPNLYINTAYTATDKTHNNVIVDLSDLEITGTLDCQGYCWIIEYTNTGVTSGGEDKVTLGAGNQVAYSDATNWRIISVKGDGSSHGTELEGTSGAGENRGSGIAYVGKASAIFANITIKAFCIYIHTFYIKASTGGSGVTEYDLNGDKVAFPAGDFSIGSSGRNGSNGPSLILEAIDEIQIVSGGSVSILGGDGGDGLSTSAGAVGNLGGEAGGGGDGGDLLYTCRTFTNNGTISLPAGGLGAVGVGSGGSNNNASGAVGEAGAVGTITATLYDFTTGLPSGYASWMNALSQSWDQ